jgi:dipeptidyl aminopeptidase/acylaminoacyl peptidase
MFKYLFISTIALGVTMEMKPYGSWKSPLTAEDLTKDSLRLGSLEVEGDTVYWTEGRPQEKGRNALMSWRDGTTKEITQAEYNVRTTVHEYGGGAFNVMDGELFFSNYADQKLYHIKDGKTRVLADRANGRYANIAFHPDGQTLYSVYEEHDSDVLNAIASIDRKSGKVTIVARGHDFYTSPVISPDGKQLAFITWDVPLMPWDGSTLWLCDIQKDGTLSTPVEIAGGSSEAIIDPRWSPEGVLHFCGDKSGFWNIYKWTGEREAILPKSAEFGYPHWVFGISHYGFLGNKIAAVYTVEGSDRLAIIDVAQDLLEPIELPFTAIHNLRIMGNEIVFEAASPDRPDGFYRFNPETEKLSCIRKSEEVTIDKEYISLPESIAYPTTGGKTAYAFYFPPKNRDFKGPENKLPPLIVQSHGGPTAQAYATYRSRVQYWTTRGFGFLDVNYGGSTGYGREYRDRLLRNWGIVDIDDCVNGALYLANQGRIDKNCMTIRGGSAGGYTTLAALAFRNVFVAGASYFGVSDLEALANDSHKFEAHYDSTLVGPLPEAKRLYKERSPIYHADKISCPMIIFQGDEDKIVPPNQAELMVNALKKNNLPVAYILFEGEQHGFRKAKNIIRSHEAELYFYSKIFNFPLSEEIKPVHIANFPD